MLELSLNCSRISMVCIHSSACSHFRYTFTFVSHSHLYIFMFIYDYVYSIYWHSMTWSPSLSLIHSPWFILCFVFHFVFHFMFHFVSLCHTETRPPCVVSPPPSIPPNVPEKEVSKKIGSVMPEPILSLSSFPLPWYCVAAWVLDVWWPIQTFVFCPPNVIPWFVPGITKRNGTERNGSDVLDVM